MTSVLVRRLSATIAAAALALVAAAALPAAAQAAPATVTVAAAQQTDLASAPSAIVASKAGRRRLLGAGRDLPRPDHLRHRWRHDRPQLLLRLLLLLLGPQRLAHVSLCRTTPGCGLA